MACVHDDDVFQEPLGVGGAAAPATVLVGVLEPVKGGGGEGDEAAGGGVVCGVGGLGEGTCCAFAWVYGNKR